MRAVTYQISIRVTSEKYRPVANRSSLLFFLMNDLVKIHSYYIYSLAAFTKVYECERRYVLPPCAWCIQTKKDGSALLPNPPHEIQPVTSQRRATSMNFRRHEGLAFIIATVA